MRTNPLVHCANIAFQSKQYKKALDLYYEATTTLGEKNFIFNISLCKKKLGLPEKSYLLENIGFSMTSYNPSLTIIFIIKTDEDATEAIIYYQQLIQYFLNIKILLVVDTTVDNLQVAYFYSQFNRLGYTVTSMRHIFKYALKELYYPIKTDYFLQFHQNMPNEKWIDKAMVHLQYMPNYVICPDFILPEYQIGLGMADIFLKWVKSNKKISFSYFL